MYILVTRGRILGFPDLKTLVLGLDAILGDAKVSLDGPYRLQARDPWGNKVQVLRLAPFLEALTAEGTVNFTLPLLNFTVPHPRNQ